ncbi:hypothetical protein [Hymenobacter sp. HDW8]|uniref:hypothetical protein n=1 Tax=Hymenobacter sp. HDW8 TaxID=2714932 RepID=UPI00140CEFBD|nr:hypothetical protein [Hymenobacter sp. HDW8]QIL74758.1 hypothetical protein G7064_01945 [Hymenobacter sp. HDW8]
MKLMSGLYAMGVAALLAPGGLFGCSNSSASQAAAQLAVPVHFAFHRAETPAAKKPKPGRKPKTKADYDNAIASVKKYRENHPSGGLHNGYISKQLVKDLLANGKCEGLRMYLADSAGQERMVVIGVDKDGADLVNPINLEEQSGLRTQGKYLFGISEDKCPENCVGAALYQ